MYRAFSVGATLPASSPRLLNTTAPVPTASALVRLSVHSGQIREMAAVRAHNNARTAAGVRRPVAPSSAAAGMPTTNRDSAKEGPSVTGAGLQAAPLGAAVALGSAEEVALIERESAGSGLDDGGALPEVLAHASGLARALCTEPNDDGDAPAGSLALAVGVDEAEGHADPLAIAVAASDIEGGREAKPEPLRAAAADPVAPADAVS